MPQQAPQQAGCCSRFVAMLHLRHVLRLARFVVRALLAAAAELEAADADESWRVVEASSGHPASMPATIAVSIQAQQSILVQTRPRSIYNLPAGLTR
jgi:hypothetical protein